MQRNIIWAAGLTGLYFLLDISLAHNVTWPYTFVSLLISFAELLLFSIFLSSLYLYKPLKYVVALFSLPAALPILHFFYYQTYREFISPTLLQSLLHEPLFLISTLYMQMAPYTGWIVAGLVVWYGGTSWLLYPLFTQNPPAKKPLAFYHRAFRIIVVLLLIIGIRFFLRPSYRMPGHCYGILAALLLPFLWFVWKVATKPIKQVVFSSLIITIITTSLYCSVLRNQIHLLRLGANTYLTFVQTCFVPFNAPSLAQPPEKQQDYKLRPKPNIPFNVLVIVNDGLRARNLGAYGYTQRYPDEALHEFYKQADIFQYALSPAHFTTTSIVAMFAAQGPQRTPEQIQTAWRLWDFAPSDFFTFYVFSSTKTWGGLDKFLSSFNMQHLWSFVSDDDPLGGLVDMMDDEPAVSHTKSLIQEHPRFIGVLHTNNTHFPFYQNPAVTPYYRPCRSSERTDWPQASINCYDNAIRHLTLLEADLFKSLDLSNTVIVFTADHG